MSRNRATIFGFTAIALWSLLALLTVTTSPVPPFQLTSMAFSVGGGVGLIWLWYTKQGFDIVHGVGWPVWLLGIFGLFGYHFLYFLALRIAPAAEASLIAYLWPLLIVLFSGFLPGEHLKWGHIFGAVIALAGAALIILSGNGGFSWAFLPGYVLAGLCALTWSGYSVLSRRMGHIPTGMVTFFCLATAVLSLIAHLLFEPTRWPGDMTGWISILGLGLGPVGLAFYLWDIGMKKGDIQILGVASYVAPLLSTVLLIATGIAAPSRSLLAAAILIALGAMIAARTGRS